MISPLNFTRRNAESWLETSPQRHQNEQQAPVTHFLGHFALGTGLATTIALVRYHFLEINVSLVARPLSVGERTDPYQAVLWCTPSRTVVDGLAVEGFALALLLWRVAMWKDTKLAADAAMVAAARQTKVNHVLVESILFCITMTWGDLRCPGGCRIPSDEVYT